MTIERKKNEIIITISSAMGRKSLQELLSYIRYKELTAKSRVKQATVDKLAKTVNKAWWAEHAKRFGG